MTWLGPRPSESVPEVADLNRAMAGVLQSAAEDLRGALELGSPVRTGTLKGSWSTEPMQDGARVVNSASYAPYVDIDTTQAEAVIDATSAEIGRVVNQKFGG